MSDILRGSLVDTPIHAQIAALMRQQETGLLIVTHEKLKKQLLFSKGVPIAIHSNAMSESLGRILETTRRATPAQIQALRKKVKATKQPMEKLVISQKLVSQDEFERLQEALNKLRLVGLYLWDSGQYGFARRAVPEGTPLPIPSAVNQLAKKHAEQGKVLAMLQARRTEKPTRVKAPIFDLPSFELPEQAQAFYQGLDGNLTIGDVLVFSGVPPADASLWLHILTMGGLVVDGAAPQVASSSEGSTSAKTSKVPGKKRASSLVKATGSDLPAAPGAAATTAPSPPITSSAALATPPPTTSSAALATSPPAASIATLATPPPTKATGPTDGRSKAKVKKAGTKTTRAKASSPPNEPPVLVGTVIAPPPGQDPATSSAARSASNASAPVTSRTDPPAPPLPPPPPTPTGPVGQGIAVPLPPASDDGDQQEVVEGAGRYVIAREEPPAPDGGAIGGLSIEDMIAEEVGESADIIPVIRKVESDPILDFNMAGFSGRALDTAKQFKKDYIRFHKMNYFELFGVDRRAKATDIRKAYFALVKEYHTDKLASLPEPVLKLGTEIFNLIQGAYDTLTEPETREKYVAMTFYGKADEEEAAMEEVQAVLQADQHYKTGVGLLNAGNLGAAHAAFSRARELYPKEAEYNACYGYTLYRLNYANHPKKAEEGEKLIHDSIRINGKLDRANVFLGRIYMLKEDYRMAARFYVRALKINPTNLEAGRELQQLKIKRDSKDTSMLGALFGKFKK